MSLKTTLQTSGPGFTETQKKELSSIGKRTQFKGRKHIFYAGDTAESVFLIETGKVDISIKYANGREIIVEKLSDGSIFGLDAATHAALQYADAIAHRNTFILTVPVASFFKFLEKHPKLYISIIRDLSGKLIKTNGLIEELFFENTLKRTAAKLLQIAVMNDTAPESLIETTQEDIAKMLGTSRETVNRNMQELQRLGLIYIKRRKILIPDTRRLEKILTAE